MVVFGGGGALGVYGNVVVPSICQVGGNFGCRFSFCQVTPIGMGMGLGSTGLGMAHLNTGCQFSNGVVRLDHGRLLRNVGEREE